MNAALRVDLMRLLAFTREDPLWEAEKSGWRCFVMATTVAITVEGASSARLGSADTTQRLFQPIQSTRCYDGSNCPTGRSVCLWAIPKPTVRANRTLPVFPCLGRNFAKAQSGTDSGKMPSLEETGPFILPLLSRPPFLFEN
jgi:hypothetical protein